MIDFIKLNISHVPKSKLLSNPHLEWIEHVNRTTGEVFRRMDSIHKNLDFVKYPTVTRVSGSLHSLHRILTTGERQNYDDFNFSDLKEVIQYLADQFKINPKKTLIENLEYGVNVSTLYTPKKIIEDHLTMWDHREANSDMNFDRKGKFKQWSRSQYDVKIYDKSLHFQLNENILRFEKRVRKSAALKKFDIKYLADLLDINKLELLRDDLLAQFDKLTILDSIELIEEFTVNERETFTKGINPLTWYQFKERNRMAKKRFKSKMNAVIGNYNLDQIKQGIRKDIVRKFDKLLCYDFTVCPISEIDIQNVKETRVKRYTNDVEKLHDNVTNLPLDKESKRNKRSKQAISKIYKLNPDHPERKKRRNDKSNPRNNLRNAILKIVPNEGNIQLLIFPVDSVIQLSERQIKLLEYWKGTKWDVMGKIGVNV